MTLPADPPEACAAPAPARLRPWLLRLDTWLILAFVLLIFQIFPAAFWWLLDAVDVRNWGRGAWIAAELSIIAILIALRMWQNSDS